MSDAEIAKIVRIVQKKIHVNDYEHQNILPFYKNCLLSGFLGLLVGATIEESVKLIEDHTSLKPDGRLKCAALLWIQLSIIALFLFVANGTPYVRRILYFDDWLMGTFSGFLFALTFISVQNRLSTNITCLGFGH